MTVPTAVRTILVSPELDEATKQQLQPPCEITTSRSRKKCCDPARWIVKVRCVECGKASRRTIVCDTHCAHFVGRSPAWCASHKGTAVGDVLSLERL